MPPALPVVRVPGWRKTGKTSVATELVSRLVAKGYRVAAIKHSHHAAPDTPDSDTDRLARAGAAPLLLAAADAAVLRVPAPVDSLLDALDRLSGQADVVVAEGFKQERLGPSVHLDRHDGGIAARLDSEGGETLAVAPAGALDPLVEAIERLFHLTTAGDEQLRALIRRAAAAHGHLCPGQVLGVRMALAGLKALGQWPPHPHDLNVYVEIDRCATDAIASVTGCSPGKRSLSVLDYGKMAATFQDCAADRAVRVVTRDSSRRLADEWGGDVGDALHRQTIAYRLMPDDLLLAVRDVTVPLPDRARPPRVQCTRCGETIAFGRYQGSEESALCLPCAGAGRYYEEHAQSEQHEQRVEAAGAAVAGAPAAHGRDHGQAS